MKAILKIEIERAFRSFGLTISLLIGLIIVLSQYIMVVIPRSKNILQFYTGSQDTYPKSVFNSWIGTDTSHPYLLIYMTIFPILAALPYAVSFFQDKKGGYIKSICTRVNRKKYMVAKYIAVFVSGGVAVVIPMVINLMLSAAVLPSLIPVTNNLFGLCGVSLYAEIYFVHPYLYILIYMIIYFIYGGVFATIGLAVSFVFDYTFFILLMPFVIYYGIGVVSPYVYNSVIGYINPREILSMALSAGVTKLSFYGEALVIGLISIAVYAWKGVQDDIF